MSDIEGRGFEASNEDYLRHEYERASVEQAFCDMYEALKTLTGVRAFARRYNPDERYNVINFAYALTAAAIRTGEVRGRFATYDPGWGASGVDELLQAAVAVKRTAEGGWLAEDEKEAVIVLCMGAVTVSKFRHADPAHY